MEEKEEAELIEWLADLEHQQWWTWSQSVASKNNLRIETIERWKKLWVPYLNLSEEMKEHDRRWARKVIEVIKKHCVLLSGHDLTDEEQEIAKEISSVLDKVKE